MGRVTRWLRCLLGAKKEVKDRKDKGDICVGESNEKKRWSFARPRQAIAMRRSADQSPASGSDHQAWTSRALCYDEDNAEENRRAIAAAVTSSVADHAVLLRSRSLGRERVVFDRDYTCWAAVKIQAAFRGHLARKALRSLKAMVKLQALIRGSLVRRQTAATLQQLQSLVRLQAMAQTRRCSRLLQEGRSQWIRQEIFPRRSFENSRAIEARIRYFASSQCQGLDRSPKVVEMDTCETKLRALRRTSSYMLHPPEELPASPISSPFKLPARMVIPDYRSSHDYNYRMQAEKGRYYKTAHNTPRFAPTTPTKNAVAVDGLRGHALHAPNGPNYMAKTRSFAAKARSQSTPRHRSAPQSPRLTKKRIPAHEAPNLKSLMAGRSDQVAVDVNREEPRDHFFEQKASRDYYLDVMW